MSSREFEFIRTTKAGKYYTGFRITCAECGAHRDLLNTQSSRLPHEAAAQKFRNNGWIVGNTPRKDCCPDCQRKGKDLSKTIETPKAEPPRELGKEERRIIFAFIDDHYLGESDGYETGWNDEKVATGLGVPRAWVTMVREEFFGPETGSAEKIKAALDRLTIIEGDVKAEREKIAAIKKAAHDALAAISTSEKEIDRAITAIKLTRDEITQGRARA